ncbi:MAG: hypothetical protein KGQ36_05630 [Rickettsiales bacterium]|nr:hypothetical protein [Rickettsiales bacterium]
MKYLIINGAGASIDIQKDFPDGKKLLQNLKNNFDLENIIKNHNPSSIDHLITRVIDQNQHQDLVKRIKSAISNIILEAQNKIPQWNDNYFFDIIQNRIFVDNVDQIDVINFNYDTTLEKTVEYLIDLYESGNDGDNERKQLRISKLKDLLARLQKSHVYGFIGDNGNNINFIRSSKKEEVEKVMLKIKKAENIYFLGFGFDKTNLQNLGFYDHELQQLIRQNRKNFFVTNYVGEIDVETSGGGLSAGNRTAVVIDKRRFSNRIMLTKEEIFDCKIQIVRDGFFSRGFTLNNQGSWYPIKLYISNLSVGNAVREDFMF